MDFCDASSNALRATPRRSPRSSRVTFRGGAVVTPYHAYDRVAGLPFRYARDGLPVAPAPEPQHWRDIDSIHQRFHSTAVEWRAKGLDSPAQSVLKGMKQQLWNSPQQCKIAARRSESHAEHPVEVEPEEPACTTPSRRKLASADFIPSQPSSAAGSPARHRVVRVAGGTVSALPPPMTFDDNAPLLCARKRKVPGATFRASAPSHTSGAPVPMSSVVRDAEGMPVLQQAAPPQPPRPVVAAAPAVPAHTCPGYVMVANSPIQLPNGWDTWAPRWSPSNPTAWADMLADTPTPDQYRCR